MDLNLLTALDALLEDNSVVSAATRLHLTPPAVSRTLARIRHVTGDDILVRSGRTMVPTPYALAIRGQVRALVQEASTVLKPGRLLDIATLDRTFTLRGHDAVMGPLAPLLIAAVGAAAPLVRLRFLGEVAVESQDMLRDEVDLELGGTEPTRPEMTFQVLGQDSLVVALRDGHPLATGRLTARRLANASHVNVSRRGRLRDRIDDALSELGMSRRVAATLPTCAAALEVVAHTDFVTVVAQTLCAPLCQAFGIVTRPVPLDLPPSSVVLSWHRRLDSDVGHAWIRARVAEMLETVLKAQA